MNHVLRSLSVLAVILTVSVLALARGGYSGGGGNAVVCRDNSGKILSAEFFDLYEGRVLSDFLPVIDSAPYYSQAQKYASALAVGGLGKILISKYEGSDAYGYGIEPLAYRAQNFERLLATVHQSMRILPPGTALKPIDDSLDVVFPRGCQVEQMALYSDRDRQLLVVGDIWNALDETNKAALLIHETLYFDLRQQQQEQNSLRVRRLVAGVFSGTPLEAPIGQYPGRPPLICWTKDLRTFFIVKPTSATHHTLDFLKIKGEMMLSSVKIEIEADLSPLTVMYPHGAGIVTITDGQIKNPLLGAALGYRWMTTVNQGEPQNFAIYFEPGPKMDGSIRCNPR